LRRSRPGCRGAPSFGRLPGCATLRPAAPTRMGERRRARARAEGGAFRVSHRQQANGPAGFLPIHSISGGWPGFIIITSVLWIGCRRRRRSPMSAGPTTLHTGESMVPEFEPGDIALVEPHLPVVPDTTCIFYGAHERRGAGTIKRLRARPATPGISSNGTHRIGRRPTSLCRERSGRLPPRRWQVFQGLIASEKDHYRNQCRYLSG